MAGPLRCPKCKRWLSQKSQYHLCSEPTEQEVMGHLEDDLLDAWKKLRDFACELGEQRIYASANAVMFSRDVCYLFVKPKKAALELCFFLPAGLDHAWVKSVKPVSKTKFAHVVLVRHEDEICGPLTGWIVAAWENLRADS